MRSSPKSQGCWASRFDHFEGSLFIVGKRLLHKQERKERIKNGSADKDISDAKWAG